jgi:hypothetical protein
MSQPQPTTGSFERLTARAHRVIGLAGAHAWHGGRDSIDTEHLLLAIAEVGEGTAAMALAALRISLDEVHRATVDAAGPGHGRAAPHRSMPFTAAAGAVLDRARREADTLGHLFVGTDHLLLALTTQTGSIAAQVLTTLGVTEDQLRPQVERLLNIYPQGRQTDLEAAADRIPGGRRFALPVALDASTDEIAEARWQKELAVDDEDFVAAAVWRDEEKRLLAAKHELANTWAARVGTVGLVEEIDRLYRQAEQLRDLLDHHGITVELPCFEPWREPASRERRPPPDPAAGRSRRTAADDPARQKAPTIEGPVEPVAVAPETSVNIRGWLEGEPDHIALVNQFIEDSIHDHWLNVLWRFPGAHQSGHGYAFYGGHMDTASVDWFTGQLRRLAAIAPETAANHLRGLFLATGPNDETVRWFVRNRQLVIVPGEEYQEHPGAAGDQVCADQ